VNQGVHVVTGLATVPLLLAKLFAVYPNLLAWPPVRGLVHGLERASVGVLVAAALFQVSTGVMNIYQWYPWGFGFPAVHWAMAWVAIGALLVHVAVQLPAVRRGLSRTSPDAGDGQGTAAQDDVVPHGEHTEGDGAARTRRGFLLGTGLTVAAMTIATAGQTVTPLRPLSVLAPRRTDVGPQGLPVNRSAAQANVTQSAVDPAWALELVGPGGTTLLDRAALLAMPQHSAVLPIACVEGWSASALWSGVRVADLVALAGGSAASSVAVTSLQERGTYRASELPAVYVRDADTMLALRLRGEDLHIEHGFPARIMAPNRPGVLQTKWVARMEVSDA